MKRLMQYKFTLLATAGILIAILMPGSDVPSVGIPNIDKVIHFSMFAVLMGCFAWEYCTANLTLPKWYIGILWPIAFAGLTERIQLYVPGRSCDIKDFICDSLGIVCMALCLKYYDQHRR